MLATMPIGDPVEATAVATTGAAYLIPTAHPVTQIKVYVSAKAYVAFGNDATPPASPANWDLEAGVLGVAVQQAGTEEVYTRAARRGQALPYLWVAAKSGTTDVDVSWFG